MTWEHPRSRRFLYRLSTDHLPRRGAARGRHRRRGSFVVGPVEVGDFSIFITGDGAGFEGGTGFTTARRRKSSRPTSGGSTARRGNAMAHCIWPVSPLQMAWPRLRNRSALTAGSPHRRKLRSDGHRRRLGCCFSGPGALLLMHSGTNVRVWARPSEFCVCH